MLNMFAKIIKQVYVQRVYHKHGKEYEYYV